jgi:hypothetical protein
MWTVNPLVIGAYLLVAGSALLAESLPQSLNNVPQQRATAELVCRAQLTPELLTRASLTGPQTTEGLASVAENSTTRLQQLHELDGQIRLLSTEVEQLNARVSTGRASPQHLEQHKQVVNQLNHLRRVRSQVNEQTRAVFTASLDQAQRQSIVDSRWSDRDSGGNALGSQGGAGRSLATNQPSITAPYVCPNVRSAWRAGCGMGNQ